MKKLKMLIFGISLMACFNLAIAKKNNIKNLKNTNKIEFKKTDKKISNKYLKKQKEILDEALKNLNKKQEKEKKYKFTNNQKEFIKLVKEKLKMQKKEEFEKKGTLTQDQIFNEYEKLMKENFEKNKQDETIFLSYMYPDNNLQIVLTPSKNNQQGFKLQVFYGEGSEKIDLYEQFLEKIK